MFNKEEFKQAIKEAVTEVIEQKYAPFFKQVNNLLIDADNYRVYTVPQVARMVRRSEQTVRRWMKEGLLAASENNLISQAALNHFFRIQEGLENKPGQDY